MTASNEAALLAISDGTTGVRADGRVFLQFRRQLDSPIERVWRAISEESGAQGWLARRVVVEARVGGRFALWLGGPSDAHVHDATITRLDPPRLLDTTCEEGGDLRWELEPVGTGCVLTFTHTLPAGERTRNAVLAGWHFRVELLEVALASHPADWVAIEKTRNAHGVIARIEEIYWHYRGAADGAATPRPGSARAG